MIDCGVFDFDDEVSNAVTPDDASCTTTSAEDEVLLVDLVDDTTLTEMLPDATCVAACETEYPDNAVIACDEFTPAVCHKNVGDDSKDPNLTDTDIMSLLCYASYRLPRTACDAVSVGACPCMHAVSLRTALALHANPLAFLRSPLFTYMNNVQTTR